MSFQCRGCGQCCRWEGHVLLTDEDIQRLALHLDLTETEFIEQYTEVARNRAGLTIKDAKDGSCIFLEGQSCSVYIARPQQCRDFPHRWTVAGCPNNLHS